MDEYRRIAQLGADWLISARIEGFGGRGELRSEGSRMLFCGDALLNETGVQLPLSVFSGDGVQAEKSARKLTARPVEIACFGHGEPILERAGEKIKAAIGQRVLS